MATYTFRDGLDDVHILHAVDDEDARLTLQARVVALEHKAGGQDSPASQLLELRDERGIEIRDPLAHQRSVMLERHRAALHARDTRSPLTTTADRDELRAIAARYEPAVSAYPFSQALELAVIDRGRAAARTLRESATRAAADARAAREALPRRHRDARAQLAEQITRHEARAALASEHLEESDREERAVRDSGRHLDQWVHEHGEDANRWAHAQRALDRLDARDIEQAGADAITSPPQPSSARWAPAPATAPSASATTNLSASSSAAASRATCTRNAPRSPREAPTTTTSENSPPSSVTHATNAAYHPIRPTSTSRSTLRISASMSSSNPQPRSRPAATRSPIARARRSPTRLARAAIVRSDDALRAAARARVGERVVAAVIPGRRRRRAAPSCSCAATRVSSWSPSARSTSGRSTAAGAHSPNAPAPCATACHAATCSRLASPASGRPPRARLAGRRAVRHTAAARRGRATDRVIGLLLATTLQRHA